jgi:membrane-bound metal-dependent hydrolase YbcI (DUF457 family)
MTSIGHTLAGIAIGIVSMPKSAAAKTKVAHLTAFALLANIPDFPLENWGHDRYDVSHSIFVNLLLIGIVMVLSAFLQKARTQIGGWQVLVGGALAWLSHLLLDSFYNHGLGIALFWPFFEARLILPIPWFSVVYEVPPPITPLMVREFLVELISYLPFVVLAILIKRARSSQRAANSRAS